MFCSEFKGDLQKTTCNISLEGGLDLDTTLTEKKIVSGEKTNLGRQPNIGFTCNSKIADAL